MSDWINVNERLPENGIAVLTWNGRDRCIDKWSENESENLNMERICSAFDLDSTPVTHWMPLPEPPTA